MTDRTLCPVVFPVVGNSPVSQYVVIISKLLCSVHQEPDKFREGKFEHFFRVLICLRVIFVPDPRDLSVYSSESRKGEV